MSDQNEQSILKEIALAGLKEQRRSRRWGIFFKLLGFAYLFFFIVILSSTDISEPGHHKPHVAVVDLSGAIIPGETSDAENIIESLQDAFESKNSKGVILRINSPGGTPVQAGMIHDQILALREKYPDKPIHSVVTDICASGGYYVAVATDKIYADKASLVGSIGVRLSSFGFTETMKKIGVERRQITAGKNKAMLDPFSPRNKDAERHMSNVLKNTHQQFINVVKQGRGDRLKVDDSLFSGLIWSGEQSLELGLIDDLGSVRSVAKDVFELETLVNYTVQPDLFDRFTRGVGRTMISVLSQQSAIPWL